MVRLEKGGLVRSLVGNSIVDQSYPKADVLTVFSLAGRKNTRGEFGVETTLKHVRWPVLTEDFEPDPVHYLTLPLSTINSYLNPRALHREP